MGVQPSLRRIGKYEVIDVLGQGGMGIVFRAHDPAIGRTVAIKMLRQTEPGGGTGQIDRFFSREMKSTGSLHHKNIVTVYDSGEQDGNPYLVMEYLEGDAISKLIAERRPIPLVEKLDVVVQICDGLQYAHDHNIVHRDIKPANVILLADGTAKIVDFGVARVAGGQTTIVQAGQLVGSLYYLSPEQINSHPIDGRSDIFSTGILLYEFLTNELPFKGADPASTFVKILTEEPPPIGQFVPDIPELLQTVIDRALAKNVSDRYQTAQELGLEINAVQKQLTAVIIADCMTRAEAAMQRSDLDCARVHLLEVTRLDRQHDRANRLLRDVRKAIQQEQRSSQIVQMRTQSQVALAGGQYEEALACADQALRLDPFDKESTRLYEEIRAAILRARAFRDTLNRAESALFAGDFDEAKNAVEESLRLDPTNSETRALASIVDKELAERNRRQRVQDFVDQARRGIADRNFAGAVGALHQAKELDPGDSNIHELLRWAERGQEEEKRRRYLHEITDQIEKAMGAGDFSSAFAISEMGLQRAPGEPSLVRLRAISEKQRDIAERRRFVQDQTLVVRNLTDQGRLGEAIATLSLALSKYPGEPSLESLLARTRAERDRMRLEREEAVRREEMQHAEEKERDQQAQRVLNACIEMRRSLDSRIALDRISGDADQLRSAIEEPEINEHAKNAATLVLEELDTRLRARDQAIAELEQIRRQIEQVQNVASLSDGENRLRIIKATFSSEEKVQDLCGELETALSRLRDEYDRRISVLTSLAQDADCAPSLELKALRQKARDLAEGFTDDSRIGVLQQQIESSVSERLEAQATRARDMENLFGDLLRTRSLHDLARIVDRGKSIAALDQSDGDLAARAVQLQTEANRVRTFLESSLSQMSSLAQKIAAAPTIEDAEAVIPHIRALADCQPDFQDLQEAATRLLAQVQGRRIEHDLIVQELESTRVTLPTLGSEDDLRAASARAGECRSLHRSDPRILALASEIQSAVEGILRERAELRERATACDAAIRAAEEQLRANNPSAALETLLAVQTRNPDRADLSRKIAIVQKQLEQARVQHERQEQERIPQEGVPTPVRHLDRSRLIAAVSAGLLVVGAGAYLSVRTLFAPSPMLRVTIAKSPADATLVVDGQVKKCPAICALQLTPGDHKLTLAHAGYSTQQSTLTLARSDNNRVATFTLEPAATGVVPTMPAMSAGSSISILGEIGAAAVSLDGKASGDLAFGRLDLGRLAPGSHQIVVARGRRVLRLSVGIAQDGSLALDSATGLDEYSVIATIRSGQDEILFCRCNGNELQIDGRKIKSFEPNLYRIAAPAGLQRVLTLIGRGQSQSVTLQAAVANEMIVLVQPPAPSQLRDKQQRASLPPATAAPNQQLPKPSPQPPAEDTSAVSASEPAASAPAPPSPDAIAWNSISNTNDLAVLRDFRARFPSSAYATAAYQRMESISWNSVRDSAQAAELQQFLRNYPDSSHAPEISQRIAALQAKSQQQQTLQQDTKQILAAVETYRTAYQARDLKGLSNIWLTVPRSDLEKTFKVADRIEVTVTPSAPSVNGDTASVTAVQRIVIVIHHQPFPNNATVLFSLSKLQGRWVIRSVK
ncbi:MAG TPA: protein kinase [Acidobacteriaceae bacterium]|nr:protein kinase [Acidobacteriaceae bacterium]